MCGAGGDLVAESEEAFGLMVGVITGNEVQKEVSRKLFEFYMQFVERERFTRVWTIQELVLTSQDPLVSSVLRGRVRVLCSVCGRELR